jgi:protein gp37
MADTSISWTNKAWDPVTGCNKVSAGCKNCYAETIANRFWKDRKFTDVICHEDRLDIPLHWRKPAKIFVNSMSDLFHEKVTEDFILRVFNVMRKCNQHIFQILTKRPERALEILSRIQFDNNSGLYFEKKGLNRQGYPMCFTPVMKNIHLGVSVENQQTADERIPILLKTPAAVKWLSIEPLLEDIDIQPEWLGNYESCNGFHPKQMDWVVVGCESGKNRRECKIEWIENIVDQCYGYGIPVFVKQLQINGKVVRDINEFPKHLQIQEYPKVK